MSQTSHADIHREHHEWSAQHATWKQELQGWMHQHQRVAQLLRQALELMSCRARSLELHGIAIDTMEQRIAVHENAMEVLQNVGAELHQSHHATHREHLHQQEVHDRLRAAQNAIAEHAEELVRLLEPLCVIEGTAKVFKTD